MKKDSHCHSEAQGAEESTRPLNRHSPPTKPPLCKGRCLAKQDGGVVILSRLACEESHKRKDRAIQYYRLSLTLYKQVVCSIVNLCSFLEKRTKSAGSCGSPRTPQRGICTIPPYIQQRYCVQPHATRTR